MTAEPGISPQTSGGSQDVRRLRRYTECDHQARCLCPMSSLSTSAIARPPRRRDPSTPPPDGYTFPIHKITELSALIRFITVHTRARHEGSQVVARINEAHVRHTHNALRHVCTTFVYGIRWLPRRIKLLAEGRVTHGGKGGGAPHETHGPRAARLATMQRLGQPVGLQ